MEGSLKEQCWEDEIAMLREGAQRNCEYLYLIGSLSKL
jgi:hypothetical protein